MDVTFDHQQGQEPQLQHSYCFTISDTLQECSDFLVFQMFCRRSEPSARSCQALPLLYQICSLFTNRTISLSRNQHSVLSRTA